MHKAALVLVLCLVAAAHAQHNFSRTFTVDPSGNADYTTIQAAINAIVPANPAVQQTILIYPGTYAEALTLGAARDHVELRGVDRDAVIISVPMDSDGITIQGNGDRANTIENLTIIAPDDDTPDKGRGIVIKDNGGAAPSNIRIVGVRIETAGDTSPALDFEDACSDIEIREVFIRTTGVNAASIDGRLGSNVQVMDCNSSTDDGRLKPGDNWLISGCFLETRQSAGGTAANDDTAPIELWGNKNLVVDNCALRGRGYGISILYGSGVPDNVVV